jgi:hypothetical protein
VNDDPDSTQPTDFFRSHTNGTVGNWTTAGSWQSSHDGINNWITATSAPTTSANTVTVISGDTIDITTAVSFDQTVDQGNLVVESTGTATIAGTPGLTVNSGGFFDVRGTVTNSGSVSVSGQVTADGASSSFSGTPFSYSGSNSEIKYQLTGSRTTGTIEFPATNGPSILDVSSGAGSILTLAGPRTLATEFILGNGTFAAGANLTLGDGCFIIRSAGDMTGTPIFAGVVDIEYFGSVTAGPEFPTSTTVLRNLSLGGGPIVLTVASDATVNGTLDMSANHIDMGAHTLTIAPNGHLNPGGWVIGGLQQTFSAAGAKTFPVGTANGLSSVVVNATAGTFPANFKASATQTAHPALADPTKALSRYWTLTGPGGGFTANLTFNYLDPPDVPATANENNFVIQEYSGGVFTQPGGSVNTAANQAIITGVSTFSDWTLAEPSAVGSAGSLQFSSPTYSVGEAGPTATITVTRTGGTLGAVGVSYATSNGTATAGPACIPGADFVNSSGTLSWTDGDSASKTFNVGICQDNIDEPDETVNLALTTPTGGATLGGQNTAVLTIMDDDPTPTVNSDSPSIAEGNSGSTTLTFTVTLTNPSSQTITVNYATADGTATVADLDYVAKSGTLTFLPGVTSQQVGVTVIPDTKFENNETFALNLSAPSNAVLGTNGTGTILNDDSAPTISINDVSQAEGNSGTSTMTFTVLLSNPSAFPVSINYATADGTATVADSDYVAKSGTVNFTASGPPPADGNVVSTVGNISQPISITINGDTKVEPDETFFVNLSGGSGYTAAGSDFTGQGTIQNDDVPTTNMQFSAATYSGPEGTNVIVTVNRTGDTSGTSTVHYATSNGTAMGGVCVNDGIDYVSTSGTLSFAATETSKAFQVSLCNDLFSENPAETINLTLSSPTGGSIGSQGTATIAIWDVASEFTSNVTLAPAPGNTVSTPITVSGYEGNVLGVRVTLNGVSEAIPDNVDVLLVDPSGTRKYVLMGDTGGSTSFNGVLTFEDMALVHLPDGPTITNGQNYKPTVCAPIADFGGGAPAGPYVQPGCTTDGGSLSSTFSGFNPNGVWRLYVRDDNGAGVLMGEPTLLGGWGLQFLLPTAAPVSLSGRVLTAGGLGIRNAKVTLSGGNLTAPRTVYTGSFGYYDFPGLTAGQAYIVTVEPKRYVLTHPTRVVTLLDSLADFDFIAEPQE